MTDGTIDPLLPSDVLAEGALVTAPDRSGNGGGEVLGASVRCGRPLVYPVAEEDLPLALRRRAVAGHRYAGVVFAFDLGDLPPGHRYTAVRLEVDLSDRRAVALGLDGDGAAIGLTVGASEPAPASAVAARTVTASRARTDWLRRLLNRRDTPRAWILGLHSNRFRWTYEDPRGRLMLPYSYATHALLEIPPDLTELHGTIDVHVAVAAGSLAVRYADLNDSVQFAEPIGTTAGPPDAGAAAVRLCVAADVSGYSGRINAEAERIQRVLVEVLARSRRAAGIADSAVDPQPQGDGQFTVLPAGIDESAAIPALVTELGRALREVNTQAEPEDRMRLRVALHRGLVKPAPNGWVGSSAVAVHRLLDSGPLRSALRDHPSADFVLGVPDVLFQDVITHTEVPPCPDEFVPILVDLPEKGFVEHCWLTIGSHRGE